MRTRLWIQRAVALALASCGTNGPEGTDGGADTGAPDTTSPDVTADTPEDTTDTSDADTIVEASPPLPLPDGCIVWGKPDHFAPCGYTEQLNDTTLCDLDPNADGGVEDPSVCFVLCDPTENYCVYDGYIQPDGSVVPLLGCGVGCVGRLHEAARRIEGATCAHARSNTGEYLARAAALEAAAVDAFHILAEDLERFGAPPPLVSSARRAAADEVRHAARVGALAERFGGASCAPVTPSFERRDVRSFALENAVEGCVRETAGAALALWQAERAADPEVRLAMREIAEDECDHAELAWRIDAWLATVLDEPARREVASIRDEAFRALTLPPENSALGLPSAADAARLLAALSAGGRALPST